MYGVEISQDCYYKAQAKNIIVKQDDLNQKLSFGDNYFDVIIASHVIEHLADTDTFLKEIYRILRTKGYLIIATPNLAAWQNIILLIFGIQPTIAEVSDEVLVGTLSPRGKYVDRVGPAHRRLFTVNAIKGLLEYHGFNIEACKGSGFLPFTGFMARLLSKINIKHATNIVIKARKG